MNVVSFIYPFSTSAPWQGAPTKPALFFVAEIFYWFYLFYLFYFTGTHF